MRRRSRAFRLAAVCTLIAAVLMSGCSAPPEEDMWASGETFQMTLQPLTEQEKENIRAVLAPDGEGLSFADKNGAPLANTMFAYRNMALSDAQREEGVESEEAAVEMAESCLRSMGLLLDKEDYYVEVGGDSDGYSQVHFYYQFQNLPVYLGHRSEIGVGVCKDGIESIHWYNRYSIEKTEQPGAASEYISEKEAVERCREKLKELDYEPAAEAEDMDLIRIYVYTEDKAVPMYLFGDIGVNAVFVNAVTGEATDYPWES